MGLLEEFLNTNQRYSYKAKYFVLSHCKHLDPYVLFESMIITSKEIGSIEITDEIRNTINKQATLSKLKNFINKQRIANKCIGCMLCNRKEFIEKRKLIKKLLNEFNDIGILGLDIKLNEIFDKYLQWTLKISKDNNGNYFKNYEVKNLFQEIITDLIDTIIKKLNHIDDNNKFFYQIAVLLISTKDFMNDIENIRTIYLDKGPGGQDFPDFVRKISNAYIQGSIPHEIINEEILLVMQKYNLNYRWEAWLHNILYHDINKKPNYFYNNIPFVYVDVKNKFVIKDGKKVLAAEPVLIGDENKEAIELFNKRNNQNLIYDPVKKRYKQMNEDVFEKYLRWYKLRQKGTKYREIFKIDKENFPKDWQNMKDYKENEIDIKDRLNKGLRYLKYRIYHMKK